MIYNISEQKKICSAVYPAIPQPIGLTRNTKLGCVLVNVMKSLTYK